MMQELFCVLPGHAALLAAQGLGDLRAVFAWRGGTRLDKADLEGWRQRWRITLDAEGVARRFYLKRFERPPLRRQLARWLSGHVRTGTAGVEGHNARLLRAANIAAAEPIAFGQRMAGPWEVCSFIILGEAAGESLERWLPGHVPPAEQETDWAARRRLVDELARFVAAFHARGFVHRDLYLSHVFVDVGEQDGKARPTFCLIDLQRVFRPRWRRRRWVVKDLAALHFSTPPQRVGRWERLRFLGRYVRCGGRFGSARRLARRIEARTARMRRRVKSSGAGPRSGPAAAG